MRNFYKLITLLMFVTLSTNLMAFDYIVSGAGTAEVNGTYTPDGMNESGQPIWKLSGGTYYLFSNGVNQWIINNSANSFSYGFYINSNQNPFNENIPPFTGWEVSYMGDSDAPTIADAVPGLSYSSGTFTELSADNGSIDNSQQLIITHNNFEGGTFTGTNGDNFVAGGKVIVTNLPSGLTAVITRTSSTTLSATITGNASSHANANEVANLTFTFQNSAFSTGVASTVINFTKSDLNVDFIQNYTVASSGANFTTIKEAIAAASSGDFINISGETFTEDELIINKNLTIIGQGAPNTIIQAAATYNTAVHRVFSINSGVTATIKNATIQYGKLTIVSESGGGIYNVGNLSLQNVDISNNVSGADGSGGGICNDIPGVLVINNSTIHHNLSAKGAGIASFQEAGITNSTITANSATSSSLFDYNQGGGIYTSGTLLLTNSTITNNTCVNTSSWYIPSSGLNFDGGVLTISNTIITDNGAEDYVATNAYYFPINDNGNNIVKYQHVPQWAQFLTSTTNILFNRMADKTVSTSWNRNNAALANQNLNISATLADNGALNGTQTLALLDGCFAIDAGISSGAPATDQRGYTRNGIADIGAYEYGGFKDLIWDGSESTDWNTASNWNGNVVPTEFGRVIIPGTGSGIENWPVVNETPATPAVCTDLTIASGGILVIAAGKALTVNGILTNNAGNAGLLINSDASGTGSLINSSAAVQATVNRYLPGISQSWHLLSTPVAAQAINPAFTAAAADYDFLTWYEPNGEWVNFKSTSGTSWATANGNANFTAGKGYLVEYLGSGLTKQFTGTLNSGTVNPTITSSGSGTYAAYNLVGNPYPSAIDWKAASGWARGSLVENGGGYVMSIWNDALSTGNYGAFNSAQSSGSGTNGVTQYVPVGQGFMVKALVAGTLGMADAIRVHNTQDFLKSTDAISNILRLKVAGNKNTYSDEIVVEFGHANAEGGAEKMFSFYETAPSLYTVKPDGNYSIDFRGEPGAVTIPVSFKAGTDGNYTFTASQLESFASSTNIALEDVKLNITQNLMQNPVYTFSSTKTDDGARFLLHFGGAFSIGESEKEQPITVYALGSTIYVSNPKGIVLKGDLYVYNTLGQNLLQQKLTGNTLTQLNLNLSTGYYLVKVVTANNAYNSKVFIKR